MLNSFETEVKDSFKAFWEKNLPDNKNEEGVDTKGLEEGIKEFKWGVKKNPILIIREYDIEGEEYNEEHSKIDMQEFTYMNIFENIKSKATHSCTNCLGATKKIIKEFFDYIDCNHDGNISAENLYWAMSNMKDLPYKKTTTTMTNDFFLNTMEHSAAALDEVDFMFGMLLGMYERVLSKDGISEVALNSMKVARRHVEENGSGPAFRRK